MDKNTLYKLGEHYLINGDCRNPEVVKKLCGSAKVSLVINDPPYGVGLVESKTEFTNREYKSIQGDEIQSEQSYIDFTKHWINTLKPYLTDKNAWYIFNSDKMLFALKKAMDEEKMHFAQLLIWIKSQAVPGRLDYLPQHELIVYGWFGTHTFQKSKDKSVLFCPKPQSNPDHPTPKPISLLRRLILNSSKIGDYVFDGFGGSGSTLLACEQTKRKCLMAEIDPDYCDLIIRRFEKLTGIKAEEVK